MPLVKQRTVWKTAFIREHHINCSWRHGTLNSPKVLTGHHVSQLQTLSYWFISKLTITTYTGCLLLQNHVITCLEVYRNWAISGSDDSKICIWDIETGTCLTSLYGHMGGVWSMTVLPPLSQSTSTFCQHSLDRIPLLVSGSTDRTARIWRLDGLSWAHVATLFGHLSTVRCLAGRGTSIAENACRYLHRRDASDSCQHADDEHQDPNDRFFVSGSRDGTLRLWSTRSQQCVLVLRGRQQKFLRLLSQFSFLKLYCSYNCRRYYQQQSPYCNPWEVSDSQICSASLLNYPIESSKNLTSFLSL